MKYIRMLGLLSAVAITAPLATTPAVAASPIPASGAALVDGQYGEWALARDFFAYMYRAGDSTKVAESKLYLRYDCANGVAYALVLCEPGVISLYRPARRERRLDSDRHPHP